MKRLKASNPIWYTLLITASCISLSGCSAAHVTPSSTNANHSSNRTNTPAVKGHTNTADSATGTTTNAISNASNASDQGLTTHRPTIGAPAPQSPQTEAERVVISAKTIKTKLDDITYAQISGLSNVTVQDQLNQLLLLQTNHLQLMGASDSFSSDYRLLYQAGNLLELDYDGYDYPQGAAHGMPTQRIFLMNLANGHTYQMRDLFQPGSNYLKVLSKLVRAKDTHHYLGPHFSGVKATDGFILTQSGIQVYFTPYEWTAYALGFPTFDISYKELSGVINKKGALWQAIKARGTQKDLGIQTHDIAKTHSLGFGLSPGWPDGSEWSTTFAAANGVGGQTLYAFYGTNRKTTSMKGNVFFFLGSRYLGTDTIKPHTPITAMYPNGAGTIVVKYDDYAQNNGASKPFSIRFTWTGKKLSTSEAFPKGFGQ